jgi:biopolymer transport protein ExbD
MSMRRFSQRSALVTLSEINITPLLDLAFVLLIIFVITTPLLQKSIELNLPKGGSDAAKLDKRDLRTVEISPKGEYRLEKQPMPLAAIIAELVRDYKANPKMVVSIRADENGRTKELYAVIDGCQKNGIMRYQLQTQPEKRQ